MARILEHGFVAPGHGYLGCPRFCKRGRIIDSESVQKDIVADTSEAFRQMHVFVSAPEVGFVAEIRGVDDECISLPMSSRVSHPQADVLREMRTPIERDDTDVVNHFVEDRDISGALHNPNIVVVCAGKYRRAG